jgi:hypothetical protein
MRSTGNPLMRHELVPLPVYLILDVATAIHITPLTSDKNIGSQNPLG